MRTHALECGFAGPVRPLHAYNVSPSRQAATMREFPRGDLLQVGIDDDGRFATRQIDA